MPATESEHRFYSQIPQFVNYLSLVGIFLANAAVFVPLGQRIGCLFDVLPPLRAYSWDLGGSLAGTVCFGLFSLAFFSPILGMGFVLLVIVLLLPKNKWLVSIPLLALVMFWVVKSNDSNAIWSPYYYITVREMGDSFNYMNLERFTGEAKTAVLKGRIAYDLPYQLTALHRKVLVLGAGGGTDAEVAVLNGADHVDAVEIDPVLVKLSGKFNPSAIYGIPKVSVHVDDARAFLKRSSDRYDMIVFGWLDSQALFSSMSNIRLDGYIYTVESMKMAFELLNPDGMLSLSFMACSDWMHQKLIRMVAESTGKMPFVYVSAGQVIFCAPKGKCLEPPSNYGRFSRIDQALSLDLLTVDVPTDDWPFLYLSGRKIPVDYLAVIGILMAVCIPAIFAIRGRKFSTNDTHFLFLGLGFLLIETKSIGDCSLYFGATWFVTMIVVAGILLMVLAANLVAMRLKQFHLWMYLPLFASLILLYCVDRNLILALGFEWRLFWTLLVVTLPVFFAGLIFSTTFRESANPAAFFGANLIGAMIGGFCENLLKLY